MIKDNGQGFDPVSVQGDHFGVKIMCERAAAVGAAIQIDSGPGQGTAIQITWDAPLQEPGSNFG
jgi:two-component system, NarL family, nitrate/nitrite sensor histidine kinase NarX